jgi:dTDP-4-amino-4,6-dideoxygalactose transaminase
METGPIDPSLASYSCLNSFTLYDREGSLYTYMEEIKINSAATITTNVLALAGGAPVRTKPWPRWPISDADTEQIVLEVLRSARWAISGPYIGTKCYERRFSEAFADYNNVAYCVPTTSGTASLILALLSLDVGADSEVLVPGLTWVACASSVFAVNATPILVDIDPKSLAMSYEHAISAITPRTKAILIVHPFCRLADIDRFLELSRLRGIPLIEDCSQAHGARWRGKRVGTFGDIGCFSMQQSKVLTAGEGGAAITNNSTLHRRMEQLRSDGRLFTRNPKIGHLELDEVGDVQGHNFCLSEFQAAILLDRLRHLDRENEIRNERANALEEMLKRIEGVQLLPPQPDANQTYYNIVFEIDVETFAGNSVDAIGRALTEELGVLAHPIYQPLNRHPLYNPLSSSRAPQKRKCQLDPRKFHLPNAVAMRARCLSIPNFVLLEEEISLRDIPAAFTKIQKLSVELSHCYQAQSGEAF